MQEYYASLEWLRGDQDFRSNRFLRRHTVRFDGGFEMPASSSPHVRPAPWSDPSAVDPEEMLVAALASCHMLWFLTLAAKRRWSIDRYADAAIGVMEPNAQGKLVMARVTLRPDVAFSGEPRPTAEQVLALHHEAHAECFIANSVKTEVMIDPGLAS